MRIARNYFLFVLWTIGLSLALSAQSDGLTTVKIRLVNLEREPLSQFPFFAITNTSKMSYTTDEWGECWILNLSNLRLRIPEDMGRVLSDSFLNPKNREYVVQT